MTWNFFKHSIGSFQKLGQLNSCIFHYEYLHSPSTYFPCAYSCDFFFPLNTLLPFYFLELNLKIRTEDCIYFQDLIFIKFSLKMFLLHEHCKKGENIDKHTGENKNALYCHYPEITAMRILRNILLGRSLKLKLYYCISQKSGCTTLTCLLILLYLMM